MRVSITILILCIIIFLGYSFVSPPNKPTPIRFIVPEGWQKPVYDFKENPLTKEGIELGKKIFYDATLSIDSSTSCASCHQQFAAFSTFEHDLSHGIGNNLTTRNAPALQNLAWQKDFMADGSIHHLDSQPIFPFTNPKEMAMSESELISRIKASKVYKKMFYAAFGSDDINTKKITKALSQFMLMLVSNNSKYDKVMQGKDSFILPEKLGYEIFKSKCATCHQEPMFTDYSYKNIGLPQSNSFTDNG
ncbi:MAG: cytochrome-c peroxidase, partial [Bacteroidetes bacterium]|nr:cytochrome-c peroxidase [Bacteroidota bacterium]